MQKLRDQETTSELIMLKKRALNDRLMLAERGFLDADGLDGRRWFKHLVSHLLLFLCSLGSKVFDLAHRGNSFPFEQIYGPPSDPESKLDVFPGIADAMSRAAKMSPNKKKAIIQHEIWRVARAIQRAASALRGELT